MDRNKDPKLDRKMGKKHEQVIRLQKDTRMATTPGSPTLPDSHFSAII